MSTSDHEKVISAHLEREEAFRLRVRFENEQVPALIVDEPPPLGESAGPNGVQLLASAVGTCLSQSLLFCLQRSKVEVASLETEVEAKVGRNEEGRLRVLAIRVRLSPVLGQGQDPENASRRLERCKGIFEQFCTVAESIRQGVPVEVSVEEARTVAQAVGDGGR
jgi:organic hydroperoxide reductase OsmC/OhrA